ncbi:hypothetical protein G6R29_05110 [Fructobacillus sp. M2-14]|uniref:Uncharacterized protein n=1 Tax=Fructobacillus broussonetiae TaxID=2713173 RepID=A0ABS5R0M5_9LACO|nr:hypothetical protein [Fructobacillus broussonetiae]MBS9338998.1 hypothetical protein [Fructobacillus broussonetiae]
MNIISEIFNFIVNQFSKKGKTAKINKKTIKQKQKSNGAFNIQIGEVNERK